MEFRAMQGSIGPLRISPTASVKQTTKHQPASPVPGCVYEVPSRTLFVGNLVSLLALAIMQDFGLVMGHGSCSSDTFSTLKGTRHLNPRFHPRLENLHVRSTRVRFLDFSTPSPATTNVMPLSGAVPSQNCTPT